MLLALEKNLFNKHTFVRAVVVSQLVERLLLTPNIISSNPVIGKFYLLSAALKRGREWPF